MSGGTSNTIKQLTNAILTEDTSVLRRVLGELNSTDKKQLQTKHVKVKSIKKIDSEEQYVYDVAMRNQDNPYFVGNNLLLHNSTYFTAWPAVKDDVLAGKLEWNKDTVVELYDTIANAVSDTFPDFAKKQFNIDTERGSVLKSGREFVGESAMFVKRKRYALWYYDKEGKRVDNNGKTGKVKVTGLDLKRSDTPKYMQVFLEKLLTDALEGVSEEDCLQKILKFKEQFKEMKPWLRGSPKSVNNLSNYIIGEEDALKKRLAGQKTDFSMPGHVRAAKNWNTLRERNKDLNSGKIVDGQKIVVCPLKPNDFGFTSIAYPVDETRLPTWFTDMPFDEDAMMEAIVDKKIKNVVGVLKWNFDSTKPEEIHFSNLFEF